MPKRMRRWLRPMPAPKTELIPLLFILGFAGLLLTFGLIADEMREGETRAFDTAIVSALHDPISPAEPIGPPWLRDAARDVTSLGGQVILTMVTVATAGFLLLSGARGAAGLVLVAAAGGAGLVQVLKQMFGRVRPDLVSHSLFELTRSFPSGHSTMSAVIYLTLGALLARVQTRRVLKIYVLTLATLLTVMVGVSRVYLGLHWPTDVLAGWCLGAAWAIGCWFATVRLQRRGQVERTTAGDVE